MQSYDKLTWYEKLNPMTSVARGFTEIFLMLFAKKTIVYDCPSCKRDIEYGTHACQNCQSNLSWNFKNPNS